MMPNEKFGDCKIMTQLKRRSDAFDTQISRTPKKMCNSSSVIKSLPNDLLIEILAKVATSSYTNLVKAKLVNKDFLEASNDRYIFRHVSFENFPKLLWNNSPEFWSFIENCNNNGNPESLYRKGMLEFFTHCREVSGLAYLRLSAQKGYEDACYVYGIILYATGSKDEGLEFLKICEAKLQSKMVECRWRVKTFVWYLWIKNKISLSEEEFGRRRCVKRNCILNERRNSWDWNDEDNHYEEHTCEMCKWSGEALRFCNMLRTGGYS